MTERWAAKAELALQPVSQAQLIKEIQGDPTRLEVRYQQVGGMVHALRLPCVWVYFVRSSAKPCPHYPAELTHSCFMPPQQTMPPLKPLGFYNSWIKHLSLSTWDTPHHRRKNQWQVWDEEPSLTKQKQKREGAHL
jgi:hypothetical protein